MWRTCFAPRCKEAQKVLSNLVAKTRPHEKDCLLGGDQTKSEISRHKISRVGCWAWSCTCGWWCEEMSPIRTIVFAVAGPHRFLSVRVGYLWARHAHGQRKARFSTTDALFPAPHVLFQNWRENLNHQRQLKMKFWCQDSGNNAVVSILSSPTLDSPLRSLSLSPIYMLSILLSPESPLFTVWFIKSFWSKKGHQ